MPFGAARHGWLHRLAAFILPAVTLIVAMTSAAPALAQVTAVRIWPGPDSTRVTLESPRPVTYRLFSLPDPARLVLELEGIDIGPPLAAIGKAVAAEDPLIRQARVGRFKPGVIRVVFDLKTAVAPQAFALKPINEFGHRIVLDLFPVDARDPVAAFLERQRIAGLSDPGQDGGPETTPAAAAPPVAPAAEAAASAAALGTDGAPPGGSPGAFASQGPDPSSRALRPPRGGRPLVIAVDPGHGGEDPGAIGPSGLREKDVVLAISRRLARLIDAEPGMRAHLVRTGDYFVPLQLRVVKARALKADLFVSIHADAWLQPTARGSSVYALSLSGATSTAARWLASRENEADLVGGVNLNVSDPILKQTLFDLSQSATINESLRLGRTVLTELGRVNRLHRKQVEQAGFAVLKAPDIPSILVETAFISNPEEERRLGDESQQERLARAILDGIKRYIAQTPGLRPR